MYIPRPIYLHPKGEFTRRPTFIHPTSGLPGNWALDFMAPGGTTILAPQDGWVTRWSGHDPREGVVNGDIFGWNTYFTVPDGWYFLTHQAGRLVHPGKWVKKGTPIGLVGHWPFDPGRSHSHLGFTHKDGTKDSAVKRIQKVSAGPARPDPLV
jgi:murein DD-endopeptidase MepM/ murein hydrolase activator NlpD